MSASSPAPKTPLTCAGCGVALPLGTEPTIHCRHCGAIAAVPAAYLEGVALQRGTREAYAASAPRWRALAAGSGAAWQASAAAALVLFPPCATALGRWGLRWDSTRTQALLTLPALFVAFGIWTVASTARRMRAAARSELAARPPSRQGGEPGCRACGAPLPEAPAAQGVQLSAVCGYCGTESLLIEVPTEHLRAERRDAQRSLAEVSDALGRRLRWMTVGLLGALASAALVSAALLVALAVG
ncbi:MAG: hypothetical protein KC593_11740 [Myxococcales bacterium]|nr:hypothetical protein [Myxococcales bacterium]MCB9626276.1 hypothetical protein [Sandaracinaceae bacterium]